MSNMWGFIRRQRELLSEQERVTRLLTMRRKDPRGLNEQDFVQAGAALGCHPAKVKAFYAVESSNEGFDSQGRLKILYEPHQVHRATSGILTGRKFDWRWNQKDMQIPLSYRSWKPLTNAIRHDPEQWHPYKEDENGQWQMLASAYQFHPGALAGASYGGFQILGRNAISLGYASPLHMIEELYESEGAHLEAAIRFLRRNRAIPALKAGDWATLTRIYRGSGASGAKQHAARLARAHERATKVFA